MNFNVTKKSKSNIESEYISEYDKLLLRRKIMGIEK